jgi:hypothetical protein
MSEASEDALDEFVKFWGKQGKFDLRGVEVIKFRGIITYQVRSRERTITTDVFLYFDGRRVEIIPNGWLDTDKYYTGFDPQYQTYTVEAGHVLRIQGSGPKIRGRYSVDVLPE